MGFDLRGKRKAKCLSDKFCHLAQKSSIFQTVFSNAIAANLLLHLTTERKVNRKPLDLIMMTLFN